MGHEERTSGAVGLRASGMAERIGGRACSCAGKTESEVRSTGVDAFHERGGYGLGAAAGATAFPALVPLSVPSFVMPPPEYANACVEGPVLELPVT